VREEREKGEREEKKIRIPKPKLGFGLPVVGEKDQDAALRAC
jgi:hypothetical protein